METFTVVDGVVLAVIAVSALLAYARGFVRESLSIAGWLGAAVVAFLLAAAVEPLIQEVPVLDRVIAGSCELGVLAAFAAVFALALLVFSIFTPLVSGVVSNSAIGPVDQALGLLFGVARGVLLVLIAFLVYERVLGGEGGFAQVDASHSRSLTTGLEETLAERVPQDLPGWVGSRYEDLTRNCR